MLDAEMECRPVDGVRRLIAWDCERCSCNGGGDSSGRPNSPLLTTDSLLVESNIVGQKVDGPLSRITVYLAGSCVFAEDAVAIGKWKKAVCRKYSMQALYPLDNELPAGGRSPETAMRIFEANRAMLREADALICNLTPFRSPSSDPGTVFELGLGVGLGKPVFGYTLSPVSLLDRTVAADPSARFEARRGVWVDRDGDSIEDYGLLDNLMIDCGVRTGGLPMVVASAGATHREVFERCVKQVRAWFDSCEAPALYEVAPAP
jgi:nucleoside 2-deoxyribosyltransferase